MTTPWIGHDDADLDFIAELGQAEQRDGYEAMMDMMAIYDHTKNRLAKKSTGDSDE